MLSAWVGLGLSAPEFWTITLAEAEVIMRAAADRQGRQKRMDDARFYTLAQLVSYSVNDPKKMPKFDKAFPDGRPRKAQSADDMLASMTAWVQSVKAMEAAQDG